MQRRCSSARALLFRICVLTTVLSACVTNDAAVIILTKPVLQICETMNVESMPFLIALATTANIGSALTLIGNPQNILIAASSGISFFHFMTLMAPVVLVGLIMNFVLLCIFYHKQLHVGSETEQILDGTGLRQDRSVAVADGAADRDTVVGGFIPRVSMLGVKVPQGRERWRQASASDVTHDRVRRRRPLGTGPDGGLTTGLLGQQMNTQAAGGPASSQPPVTESTSIPEPQISFCGRQLEWRNVERLTGTAACVGILVGFVVSSSIAWTALTGVAAMVLIEVFIRGGEGTDVLRHVDGFLLVMIAGLFIVIAGARRTGVPDSLFQQFGQLSGDAGCHSGVGNLGWYAAIECFDLDFDSVMDVFAVTGLVMVLSNLCSNVPTVMLLAHSLELLPLSRPDAVVGWMTLSWAATGKCTRNLPISRCSSEGLLW